VKLALFNAFHDLNMLLAKVGFKRNLLSKFLFSQKTYEKEQKLKLPFILSNIHQLLTSTIWHWPPREEIQPDKAVPVKLK